MVTQTTTEHEVDRGAVLAPEAPVGRTTGWWGMVLFIATESATFAAVLASYFYLRFTDTVSWPPPGEKLPDLVYPSVATGVLVASCVPMVLAVRTSRTSEGSRGLALGGVLLAAAGGAAFLVLQVLDWRAEWPSSTLSKDAYGSLFYSITGLHAFHVLIGFGMLLFLLAGLAARRSGPGHPEPLVIVGIYWYFMGIVAVAVYLTVYVSPYL